MELLELEEMVGIPSPSLTTIKPFDFIIERDDSEDKYKATRELAYIHFMCHHESPYLSYPKDRRPEKIIKDIWGNLEQWSPDDVVEEALNKYKELTASPYTKLFESAWEAANKLIEHFDDLNLQDPKDAKETINNLSKVGDVVEGLDKLGEQIKKHQSKQNANRAGAETNKYSEV